MKPIRVAAAMVTTVVLATACGGNPSASVSGGSGGSPAAGALAYTQCMRSHSVPSYPDPSGGGGIPKETAQQLGVSDSVLQAAASACTHLVPSGGSAQPDVAQWWTGMLNFARCMRSHGVPDWPDPTPYPPDPSKPTINVPASIQPTSRIIGTMYECQRLVPHNAVGGHIDNASWQSVSRDMAAGS